MTSSLFWLSYAAMWILLLALTGSVFILFRMSVSAHRAQSQGGVGDAGGMYGPPLDSSPPVLDLRNSLGDAVRIGVPSGATQLIVFAKNSCPKCKVALDLLHSFTQPHAQLQTVIVCGGNQTAVDACASAIRAPLLSVADLEWKGARDWHISSMPFGVILDSSGIVRGRGDPTSAAMLTTLTWYLDHQSGGTVPVDNQANADVREDRQSLHVETR